MIDNCVTKMSDFFRVNDIWKMLDPLTYFYFIYFAIGFIYRPYVLTPGSGRQFRESDT